MELLLVTNCLLFRFKFSEILGGIYRVLDKFDVEINGRKGTFVAIHGATHTPEETSRALGKILTGSGTSELSGISGTIEFKQG